MADDLLSRAIWLSTQYPMSATQFEELDSLAADVEALLPELDDDDFASAVLSLVRPMENAGRIGELSGLLVRAASSAVDTRLKGWIRIRQAEVYGANGEAAHALRVLDAVDAQGDHRLSLACTYVRAHCLRDQRNFEAAFETVEDGMEKALEFGDQYTRILLLNVRGGIHYRQARFEAAIDDFETALHLAQRFAPPTARSVRANLAYACRGARRYGRAISELEPILGSAERDDDGDSFIALSALSSVQALLGNLDEAENTLIRAARLVEWGYWRGGESELWLTRWIIAASRGVVESADDAFEQLVRLSAFEGGVELRAVAAMIEAARTDEPRERDYRPQGFISREAWNRLLRGEAEMPANELNRLEELLLNVGRTRLQISSDRSRIVADGQVLDLSRRGPSKRIVAALVDAYPEPVDPWDLVDVAWPEVEVRDPSILNRLYTTLHRLRRDGLEDIVETCDSGYYLSVEPGLLN